MGRRISKSAAVDLIVKRLFLGFVLICTVPFSHAATTPADVAAINNLYVALGSPVLPGWVSSAGDPCGELWQGVGCNDSDILSITLNGANLVGVLGDSLGSFTSIRTIDLSSNSIGGIIPSTLPPTIENLFLAANQLSGSIPATLSSLTQLKAMSLNNNQLSGELPDAFESLTTLVNLDLSNNNFSGNLPPSMENLSSIKTLRLQNNQLSGTLDVLQDLPLDDLNIENNLFSGSIPEKLLTIPQFSKDGNLFNASSSPSPSSSPPSPSPSTSTAPPFFGPGTSSSNKTSPGLANGTSSTPPTNGTKNGGKGSSILNKKVVWISIASVLSFVAIILALILCLPACLRRRHEEDRIAKRYDISAFDEKRENPRNNVLPPPPVPVKPIRQVEKKDPPRESAVKLIEDRQQGRKNPVVPIPKREENRQKFAAIPKRENHEIDMSGLDPFFMPPPPPPPPPSLPPPVPEIILTPIVAEEEKPVTKTSPVRPPFPISARSYTIASLQQFTNSFSQENLIGSGMLGNVYRAELPDGKLLAVKKLDKRASSQQKDVEFLELVNNIDKIRHANVVELMGYSAEHGQRLLIFEYCSNGTLQDALHSDDELKKNLSWNTRIRMALGAARALEYLHEVCQPPIIHRNFKSTNVLLDDDLGVRVSDCGLAPLISSGAVSQLSGQLLTAYGYGAPEFESGIYTIRSDVFSFGVVMLELLTARKSYDRNRNRGEQSLVRWAIPQLHDIDALSRMVDPSIDGQYTAKSLSRFADIISRCVQSEPEFRPPMSEVVQDLLDMIRRERSP